MRRFAKTIEPGHRRLGPVLAFRRVADSSDWLQGPSYSSMVIGLAAGAAFCPGWASGGGCRASTVRSPCSPACSWHCAGSVRRGPSFRGRACEAALGLTGVLVAMLVFLAGRYDRPELVSMLFRVLVIATAGRRCSGVPRPGAGL